MIATLPGSSFHFAALARTVLDRAAACHRAWPGDDVATKPVFENECGDSQAVEPFGDLISFVRDSEPPIPAAGADDNGRSGRELGARQPN